MSEESPWESLISRDRVMALHSRAIKEHSQSPLAIGMQAADCVDGKIGNAWQSEQYRTDDDAKEGICFAGFLLFYLVLGNCFPDGNKRVGWASAMSVLAALGLTIKASDEEVVAFVTKIADGTMRAGLEVAQWLAARLEAPEDTSGHIHDNIRRAEEVQ